MLGSCVRRERCPLSAPLLTPHTLTVVYLTFWSRHLCWKECSLALDITLDISNIMEFKQGFSNKCLFFSSSNLWLKRKLWLCWAEDMGIWGVGIIGILTLIQLSFLNWILRCALLRFCRANVSGFFFLRGYFLLLICCLMEIHQILSRGSQWIKQRSKC